MCNLLVFDALGSYLGVRFKSYNRLRSKLGGFFTLSLILISFITIGFFMQIYLSGSEIKQINNIMKFWNSQNLTLTDKFVFSVNTKYGGYNSNRSDIWDISAYYVSISTSKNTAKYTYLDKKACLREDWARVTSQFDLLGIEGSTCFNTTNLEISGNPNTETFNYISIKYTLKVNESDPVNSTFVEKTIAKLQPVASLYFIEGIFEISGKEFIPNNFINSVNINITFKNSKETEILISKDQMIANQDKIIINDPIVYEDYVISSYRDKPNVRAIGAFNSHAFNLVASNIKNVSIVNFMTFSEMLARVGGILQNLITLLFLTNYVKNYWSYECDKVNEVLKRMKIDSETKALLKRTIHLDTRAEIQVDESKLLINKESEASMFRSQENLSIIPKLGNSFKLKPSNQPKKVSKLQDQSSKNVDDQLNIYKLSDFDKQINLNVVQSSNLKRSDGNPIQSNPNLSGLDYTEELKIMQIYKSLNNISSGQFTMAEWLDLKYFASYVSCDLLCVRDRKHSDRLLVYDAAEEYLSNTLEFTKYDKMKFDLEMIKLVLLEPHEMALFESIPLLEGNSIFSKINNAVNSDESKIDILVSSIFETNQHFDKSGKKSQIVHFYEKMRMIGS